jgi:putative membrane-bound dehydrogenase-like protein
MLNLRFLIPSSIPLTLAAWCALAADPPAPPRTTALPPEQARAAFRAAPGLRVELVACEPQIESPVAMAFDEDGRLWVVEMPDYPNGPAKGQPPEGRIKILEDRDGDGRFEHVTVFADKLLFANGVLPWQNGAIVTCAPHILQLRDTDGDGKADARDVLYEGFATENVQLRVSHPNLGLDGWVYVANGLRGGKVRPAGSRGEPPVNLGGQDFRFDLVHGRHEAVSGMGQYGLTFDDWGRRFVCDNHHHIRHVVLPNRYLKRNSNLAVTAVLEDTSELEASVPGAGAKVYPLSKNWTTSNLHAGRFTAACGVFVYRGNLLPPEYRGAAFTCEPTGNLVHVEALRPHGATFRSRPPREGVEFLATPDDWCRPVFLTGGPDGALYVVDMTRAVIEHPEWMPPELKNRPDLNWGKHTGRIWRIVPEGHTAKQPRPHLSRATTEELVRLLTHPDAWWRTTAQRLLLQRQDPKAAEPLRTTLASDSPQARVQAAWLLEDRGELREEDGLRLLRDPQPRVREQAVLLAERWLASSAAVQGAVIKLAHDPDAQLRFQVALSLGEWDDDRALAPLADIAAAGADDHWTRAAVASAVPRRSGLLIDRLLAVRPHPAEPLRTMLHGLAAVVGARQDTAEIAGVLAALKRLDGADALHVQLTVLGGLADGTGRRGQQLAAVLAALPQARRPLVAWADTAFRHSALAAADARSPVAERIAAVGLLAHAPWAVAGPVLAVLVAGEPDQAVRLATVRALAAQPGAAPAEALLKPWPAYSPAVRREAAEALVRQPDRALLLLKAVEAGAVRPGDLDPARTRQLLHHGRAEVRALAEKVLSAALPEERKQVLERYRAALKLTGDARRGREVFAKNCATCHHVADLGVDVGPDISDTSTKTAEQLLNDILNPNAAIDSNYVEYQVTLKSGKVLNGLIVTETGASLTLKRAENQTETVLRQDVDEVQSTGRSLMPEGLEKTVAVADMADLLAFLKNWRYLDGSVPLGEKAK